jgi:hypothetical protein
LSGFSSSVSSCAWNRRPQLRFDGSAIVKDSRRPLDVLVETTVHEGVSTNLKAAGKSSGRANLGLKQIAN